MLHRVGLALILIALTACGSHAKRAPGSVDSVQIAVGDGSREYLLYRPRSLQDDPGKHALVIVLHGGGGTAQQIMRETGDSFFRLAEAAGFFLLFPESVNKIWDFGAGRISADLEEPVDDRSYFASVLDRATHTLPVDPDRVFATGISRGGQASYFLACEFPGRIRAIAPVAMPLPVYMEGGCRDGPPVGIAIMNGTDDPLVPYAGGAIAVGRKERDEVLSTSATVALWNRRNGCDPATRKESTINLVRDRTHVELTEWRNCTGAPVLLYSVVGGGHTWPSGSQYLPRLLVGRVTRDIDAADIAWQFFSEFR